ncbi:alcohol o-acetyltransferase 1-related [Anaeramoeba flamelloides]|uniref:Alcohol o-acetyltransferase 1-related n=1 Tax=Anaeramoeba flamelloides TaxID=1746091 RepID=A0AAV7Y8U3_9EUKA|nr:alcohol o-acetyltransferase 1-related [Anaeramoeba flamelloides]
MIATMRIGFHFQVKGSLTAEKILKTLRCIYQHQPSLQRRPKKDEETKGYIYEQCSFEESIILEELVLDQKDKEQFVEVLEEKKKQITDVEDRKVYVMFLKNTTNHNGEHQICVLVDHINFDARSCLSFVSDFMRFIDFNEKEKQKIENEIVPLRPKDFNFTLQAQSTQFQGPTKFYGYKPEIVNQVLGPIPDHKPPLEKDPEFSGTNEYGYTATSKYRQLIFNLDEELTANFIEKCKQHSAKPTAVLTAILLSSINLFWHKGKCSNSRPGLVVDSRTHYAKPFPQDYIGCFFWVTEIEELDLNEETAFWDYCLKIQKELDFQLENGCIIKNIKYMAENKEARSFGFPNSSHINNYGCYEKLGYCSRNGDYLLTDINFAAFGFPPLRNIQVVAFSFNGKLRIKPLFSPCVYKQETILNWMMNSFLKILKQITLSSDDLVLINLDSDQLN